MFQQYTSCHGETICKPLISLEISLGASMMLHAASIHAVLYQRVKNNEILLEPKVNVKGHQIGQMLLGDGENLLPKWLVKPYIFSPTL